MCEYLQQLRRTPVNEEENRYKLVIYIALLSALN